MEIIVSLEGQDLLFFGWTCRISENFYGKGPDFKEMGVLVCLRFAVISYTVTWQNKHEKTNIINQKKKIFDANYQSP